ncbi:MAG: adenylyl-sulfate kinase [Bacteroidota bacterium]|jgi:adenylylsulfate kinase
MSDSLLQEVARSDREKSLGQQAHVFWMTGLSGSGKTTLGSLLERALMERGYKTMYLDGDVLRGSLNSDLGFSPEDRKENIRRTGAVNKVLFDAGLIVINAFISPYRSDRAAVRSLFGEGNFSEIHIKADLAVCEARDPKGLYRRARAGEIAGFTGISAPYEEPLSPELLLDTGAGSLENTFQTLLEFSLKRLGPR